jgi:hypothetical protein
MFSDKIKKIYLTSLKQSKSLNNNYRELQFNKNYNDSRGIQTSFLSKISLFLVFHKEFNLLRIYSHFYSQVLRFLTIIKRNIHTKTVFKNNMIFHFNEPKSLVCSI